MVDVPGLTPVARPLVSEPRVLSIVATGVVLTGTRSTAVQVEAAVLSWVVASLNVSIAVYCWVPVTGIEASLGVTTKDTDVAPVTFNVTVAVMPSKVAVMTDDVPATLPVAKPDVALTEALTGVPEVQVEAVVLSMVDPLLYVAVAVYCWVPVTGTEAVAGVTAIDTSVIPGAQCSVTSPPPPPHPVIKKILRINIINIR